MVTPAAADDCRMDVCACKDNGHLDSYNQAIDASANVLCGGHHMSPEGTSLLK